MELSNQKRRKQVIILSNVHPANQRESLKKFPSCILIRIRGFICTFARQTKTLNSYGAQFIFGLPSS